MSAIVGSGGWKGNGNGNGKVELAPAPVAMMDPVVARERGLVVGLDNRVYQTMEGAIKAQLPLESNGEGQVWLMEWDRGRLPKLEAIGAVADDLLLHYDREVMVYVAQDREDPSVAHFMVPRQRGTGGSVEVEETDEGEDERNEALYSLGRWVGSIHSHPGNSAWPSFTDTNNWKKASSSGFHYIVARDRSYTLNVVVGGQTFTVESGELPPTEECEAWYAGFFTSDNRPLEELLLEPEKPKYSHNFGVFAGQSNAESSDSCLKDWYKEEEYSDEYIRRYIGGMEDDEDDDPLEYSIQDSPRDDSDGVLEDLVTRTLLYRDEFSERVCRLDEKTGFGHLYVVGAYGRFLVLSPREMADFQEWIRDCEPLSTAGLWVRRVNISRHWGESTVTERSSILTQGMSDEEYKHVPGL